MVVNPEVVRKVTNFYKSSLPVRPAFNKSMTIKMKKNILFSRLNKLHCIYKCAYQQTTGSMHVFRIIWRYALRRLFYSTNGYQ